MIKTTYETVQKSYDKRFCDFCGVEIKQNPFHHGRYQCRVCEKDVCGKCGRVIKIERDFDGDIIKYVEVCKDCLEKDEDMKKLEELESEAWDKEYQASELRDQMIDLYTKKFK